MRFWQLMTLSVALLLFALGLPLLIYKPAAEDETERPSASPAPTIENATETLLTDSETYFTALIDGENHKVSMKEYLPLVVAAEMPASFEREALKAQAVAARTYILYKMQHPSPAHPEITVCTDPACCKAYASESDLRVKWGRDFSQYNEKIHQAAEETDGEYLIYDGEIIQSVFHASSLGRTEDSGNVWSGVPYLVSVSTPETEETVTDLVMTQRLSPGAFAETLAVSGMKIEGEAQTWLGEQVFNSVGRVQSVEICGETISGADMRKLFSLRSADFDLNFDGVEFVFTVRGYGHGVGMSQQGANLMAKEGSTYEEILKHYYTDVQLISDEKSDSGNADDD